MTFSYFVKVVSRILNPYNKVTKSWLESRNCISNNTTFKSIKYQIFILLPSKGFLHHISQTNWSRVVVIFGCCCCCVWLFILFQDIFFDLARATGHFCKDWHNLQNIFSSKLNIVFNVISEWWLNCLIGIDVGSLYHWIFFLCIFVEAEDQKSTFLMSSTPLLHNAPAFFSWINAVYLLWLIKKLRVFVSNFELKMVLW